ncbi:MAG: phosphatase family protein [Homoserinimonas sp.]|jgi:membrane-associated phospholipid phosphatase|nr:phosphatase family protein [Homoserinimonas sp.]
MKASEAKKVTRRWPLISALVAIVLSALLGLLIATRSGNLPLSLDSEWMEEILEERAIWLDVPALFMDWIGGGIVGVVIVPVATIVVLCALKRFWAALFYGLAALASAGVVQLLKGLYGRPRPEDILVTADVGSFPSGHVANAATIAVSLGIIVGRTWVWFVGVLYTILMAVSRTYLGAHWLTDTIGGALIGAGVAVMVWAPLASRVHLERSSKRR